MIRLHLLRGTAARRASTRSWAAQLNDTHPAIAVAELMRLLVDEHEHGLGRRPGTITQRTLRATPTTRCCPRRSRTGRCRCSARCCRATSRSSTRSTGASSTRCGSAIPATTARGARLSLIDEDGRADACAWRTSPCVGSHAINGVAALHSELLKQTVLRDFTESCPEKFNNKTNGVTPRRWLVLSNPRLTRADHRGASATAGSPTSTQLARLEPLADDAAFQQDWRAVKRANKRALAARHQASAPASSSIPQSLFDVQVKRMHEYKRQHLNVLHIVTLYHAAASATRGADATPRTVIFGGKAAPGYRMAKLIIKLINAVADGGQPRPDVRGPAEGRVPAQLQRDERASTSIPAADLSEQISTAGKEASGTGNMKFALNGALTIGTLDGANVEIREAVGARELLPVRPDAPRRSTDCKRSGYDPRRYLRAERRAARGDRPDRERLLLGRRPRAVPAARRVAAHARRLPAAGRLPGLRRLPAARQRGLRDRASWTRMSILNCAHGSAGSRRIARSASTAATSGAPVQPLGRRRKVGDRGSRLNMNRCRNHRNRTLTPPTLENDAARLLAGVQLPGGRDDLPPGQPAAARAAEAPSTSSTGCSATGAPARRCRSSGYT